MRHLNERECRVVDGYQRAPDTLQPRTRLVLALSGQIWELRCSAKSDGSVPSPLDAGARSSELAFLGLALLLRWAQAMFRQATIDLRKRLSRIAGRFPVRDR